MEFPFESFSIIFEISDTCHLNEFYHEVVLHINTCIFCLFVCFLESTTPQSAQCGISRIWVHSQYRRKKVATRLLDCVRWELGDCSLSKSVRRVISNLVSKVIWDGIDFTALRSVIGLENSRHPVDQSGAS